jgi:integrase
MRPGTVLTNGTTSLRQRVEKHFPDASSNEAEDPDAAKGRKKRNSLRLHDLRHTAASVLLSEGVPVKVASEMLGHSQVKLTLDTYSHVMPHLKQEAAAAMDRAVGGRSRPKREP